MSTTQLRNIVVDKIYSIEDEKFLSAINTIVDNYSGQQTIYHLNNEQRQAIEEAERQIASDDFITNEELEKQEDEWLNKQFGQNKR